MQKHVKNYLKHFGLGEQDTWYCEVCMREFPINNGLEIHHIKFRSHGGGDKIENCMSLDVKHHKMAQERKISEGELQLIHNYFLAGQRKSFIK